MHDYPYLLLPEPSSVYGRESPRGMSCVCASLMRALDTLACMQRART
jgi:hypothetical protein